MVFQLEADSQSDGFSVPQAYIPFQVEEGEPEICITAHSGMLGQWGGELVFDSKGPWKLWRLDGQLQLSLHNSPDRKDPYQVALVDDEFTSVDIYTEQSVIDTWDRYFPMNYPLDEVVAVNRLAFGHGIEVHASGISDSGRGILFLGVSGSGKSTMSRLWDEDKDVTVLSDDRIIITPRQDGFWIHGTPWHGDAGLADPAGVRLEAIFFIGHAPENRAAPIGAGHAASQMLARSFPTFWRKEGMQYSAGLTAEIAQSVPRFQFDFAPGRPAVEYVRELLGS